MEFEHSQKIKGVVLIKPKLFQDERGTFAMTYLKNKLEENGIFDEWVQDNESDTLKKGMLRGLHFQRGKDVQAKLVTVKRGRAFVAIVDLRAGSETYGQYETFDLDDEQKYHVYVPAGFAHGFLTLEDNTRYFYKVSSYYAKESDGGLRWNDPEVGIKWPVEDPFLIERDANLPLLNELKTQGDIFAKM